MLLCKLYRDYTLSMCKMVQEYINYKKRYVWRVPERIEGQIDKGDIVWVHVKKKGRDIKTRVLVVNVLEQEQRHLRSVIAIDKKYNE
ncbi:DUF5839 family protein [Clostridium perfringens]|uniref:DUF5839 family protein n=1 Tax=Clostridium perfringens TaxID=1502 RepID=UPI0026E3C91E|nr:DUF5839 family protein [Clostridium perfringens]MDO6338444.1 DUF5839 family protein [Clostridium perfringens]